MSDDVASLQVSIEFEDKNSAIVVRKAGEEVTRFTSALKTNDQTITTNAHHHESFVRSFRNIMITVAATRFALLDFNDVFLSLPRTAIKAGAEIERLTALMKGLSKQTDEAKRNAEAASNAAFVIKTAQNAPFQIKQIGDAFVKLKTAGIDPTNGSLQALIDSVARFGGDSDTLHRASIAIQQMAGKGVISMEELRQQLGEAMPTAMAAMAQGVGMSMADMVKAISNGQIQAQPALERLFLVMKAENSGAAAELMKTWNGLQSQLLTQWMLFQNEIANSGFGQTMKDLAKEALEYLKSDDAKQFATELGHDFAAVAQQVGILIKTFANLWPQIKAAGELFLLYWSVEKIGHTFDAIKSKILGYQAAMTDAAEKSAAQARADIALKQQQIIAEKERLAQTIADNDEEIVANRAKLMKMQADLELYEAQVIAIQSRIDAAGRGRTSTGKFMSAADTARQLANAAMLVEAQKVAIAAAGREAAAMETLTVATRAAIAEKEVLVGTLGAEAASLGAAAGKAGLFATALDMLGGPLGALATVLTIVIPLWMEFGNKGEDAIKKIKNALDSGTASSDTVNKIDTQIAEKQKQLQDLEDQMRNVGASFDPTQDKTKGGTRARNDRMRADLAQYTQDLDKLLAQRMEAYKQWKKNEGIKAAQIEDDFIRQREADLSKTRNAAVAKINQDEQTALETAGAVGSANYKKVQEQAIKERTAATVKYYADLVAVIQQRRTTAAAALAKEDPTSKTYAADKAKVDKLNALYNQAAEELRYAQEHIGNNVDVLKPSQKQSAAEKMIISLRAQLDGLNTQLSGGVADRLRVQLERLINTPPGKNGQATTAAQIKEIRDLIGQIESAKINIKTNSNLDQLVQGAQGKVAALKSELEGDATPASERLGQAIQHIWDTMKEGTPAIFAKINQLEQLRAEMKRLETEAQNHKMKLLDDQLKAATESERAVLTTQDDSIRAAYDKDVAAMQKKIETAKFGTAQRKQLEEDYAQWLIARTNRLNYELDGPLAQLTKKWSDSTANMKQATADWTSTALDDIVAFCTKGENRFGQFVEKILEDILRMQLQATMGKQVGGFINSLGNMALNWMTGGQSSAAAAVQNAAAQPGAVVTHAALGGLYTPDFGMVPLRKYAMGGIAKSPQALIYGEAGPEAFVPLPDGRTIPVTMKGDFKTAAGATPTVIVNVINQSGQQVKAEQKGQPRLDGKQMILDVVLSAAAQPGPFRDGMKANLK